MSDARTSRNQQTDRLVDVSDSDRTGADERSLGELAAEITANASQLARQEVELAKTELKEEAIRASKTAAMFSAAIALAYLTLILLAFAAAWGLTAFFATGWAFLLIGLVSALLAGVAALVGRRAAQNLNPVPEQTIETLREDVTWAKQQVK